MNSGWNTMRRDWAGGGLTFPIKLRCASLAGLLSEPGLEAALTRALGRAFARARSALPAPVAIGGGVVLQPPFLTGGGFADADKASLLARVWRAIEAAARAQSLPRAARPMPRLDRRRAAVPSREVAERFDPERFDPETGTYEVPSYQGKRRRAAVKAKAAPAQKLAAWTTREVEFFVKFGRFLYEVGGTFPDPWRVDPKALRERYADLLNDHVAAVVWVVDVHSPMSWRALIGELLGRRSTRFGGNVPTYYFWDADRRNALIDFDPKHLRGKVAKLKPPPTLPAGAGDFMLPEGTRFAFVACTLPELDLKDVVSVGRALEIPVSLASLFYSNFVATEDFKKVFRLSDGEFESYLLAWGNNPPVVVCVLPLTTRRRVSVPSLRNLILESVQRVDRYAGRFGQLLLLSGRALDELPDEIAVEVRRLVDNKTLAARDTDLRRAEWQANWRGIFVHPLFQDVPAQAARTKFKESTPGLEGLSWAKSEASAFYRSASDNEKLAKFIDDLPEDYMLFEILLDELERQHNLGHFFDSIREATGNEWWWREGLGRKYKVTRLAYNTRHRDNPALHKLIQFLQSLIVANLHHSYDFPSQSILFYRDSDLRLRARGHSKDDTKGVVSELRRFYSETATVPQPNKELMKRLSEPVRKKIGEFTMRMACEGTETMTVDQLICEATLAAMKELKVPPEKGDFVSVKLRKSLRVLALEEPIIDGVPQLRVKFEPVTRIGNGEWQAAGRPESLRPGDFEARLTYYTVQHELEALTLGLAAATAVVGGIIIVVTEIASLVGLVFVILLSEALYLWTTPWGELSVEGFIVAALLGELSLVGFKGLSLLTKPLLQFAGRPLIGLAGRLITGNALRTVATRAIAFGLRGGAAAAAAGGTGVLDLFARDLFGMTRCKGFSSPESYWDTFKTGAKIGLLFEFVAVPLLAPSARAALGKASTYLEAAGFLRRSGKSLEEVNAALLKGQIGLEDALDRTLARPDVTEPLKRSSKKWLDEFFKTIGREYKEQASRAFLELADLNLDRAGRAGLSRILEARSARDIDILLESLKHAKVPPAEFLRMVGKFDADALATLLKGTNLTQLARSPKALALFGTNSQLAIRILRGPFKFSVENYERYLGELERLPAPSRGSVLNALVEGNPLPPDLLLRAARGLGRLDPSVLAWLRRLHEARIPMNALFENSGKPFRDFVERFSKFSPDVQTSALQTAVGRSPAQVLKQAEATAKPGEPPAPGIPATKRPRAPPPSATKQSSRFPKLNPEQVDFLERLLEDIEARGFPEPDMGELRRALDAAKDEAGRWDVLRSVRKSVHLRAVHAGETRRGEFFSEEVDPKLASEEGLHRAESAHMVTTEGAERVGAIEGRKYAERELKLRDANWVNPFEARRSRFGTGIDDVLLDAEGNYWVVEYKGGTAKRAADQMEPSWIRRKIAEYRTEGGPLGKFWADKLETALKNGRLRGVELKTKVVGRTPQPTKVVKTWEY